MCSEFMVNTTSRQVEEALGTSVVRRAETDKWEKTVRFSTTAPIVEKTGKGLEIAERVFPVSPFPNARLSGFESQSDSGADKEDEEDKQIRRIYDVPRWKKTFASHPVLVPMTGFTEFAYWGEKAGSALNFEISDTPLFFAAGVAIKPFVPKTGKENGFSILTHTATQEMLKHHHRLIVLLKPEVAAQYLEEMTPQERFHFLIENRYTGPLHVTKLRNMAKGWEKRAPAQNAKLKRESRYRDVLKAEKVDG